MIKLLCAIAILIYMFLSVYTTVAGGVGFVFKWLLCALFGEGAYYIPLITVYIVVLGCIHLKTGDGLGKIITAFVLMPIISMGMSESFEEAIVCGSDIVRVGRALFTK